MEYGKWQAAELQNHIDVALSPNYPISTIRKNKSVMISNLSCDKGTFIKRTLEHHRFFNTGQMRRNNHSNKIDFIFAFGIDRSDETIFEFLKNVESENHRLQSQSDYGSEDWSLNGVSERHRRLSSRTTEFSVDPLEALLQKVESVHLNKDTPSERELSFPVNDKQMEPLDILKNHISNHNGSNHVSSTYAISLPNSNGNNHKPSIITCTISGNISSAKYKLSDKQSAIILLSEI